MHIHNCVDAFLSSLMQWVQGLATGVSFFRDLSLSLSCPAHCGGSSVLSFVAGAGFGLCLGLLLGLYFLWISSQVPLPKPFVPAPASQGRPRRSRLTAYSLDEQ